MKTNSKEKKSRRGFIKYSAIIGASLVFSKPTNILAIEELI